MSRMTRFDWFSSRKNGRSRSKSRKFVSGCKFRSRRLGIELLEDRRLLALTFVLDFNSTSQGNTFDWNDNEVSTFRVAPLGFTENTQNFNAISNAVLSEVKDDFFDELENTIAGPSGLRSHVNFILGDIGNGDRPNGVPVDSEYYFVQIGTLAGGNIENNPERSGVLGVARLSSVRTAFGEGPNGKFQSGNVIASVFSDRIGDLIIDSNPGAQGDLTSVVNAISSTVSHEIAHTLSLTHVNKADSEQPTDVPPLLGTGASP